MRPALAALVMLHGTRFCSLVAPYIAGEFDLGAHQLWGREEEQAEKKLKVDGGCPLFVTAYTGYIADPASSGSARTCSSPGRRGARAR